MANFRFTLNFANCPASSILSDREFYCRWSWTSDCRPSANFDLEDLLLDFVARDHLFRACAGIPHPNFHCTPANGAPHDPSRLHPPTRAPPAPLPLGSLAQGGKTKVVCLAGSSLCSPPNPYSATRHSGAGVAEFFPIDTTPEELTGL
jgi:hypothetical protein